MFGGAGAETQETNLDWCQHSQFERGHRTSGYVEKREWRGKAGFLTTGIRNQGKEFCVFVFVFDIEFSRLTSTLMSMSIVIVSLMFIRLIG